MSGRSALWAITCVFSPVPSSRRLANFRTFRKHLGIPLVAVEAVYDETELTPADAEILVQRPCESVLWQKERLLNLALEALPVECERVAILDADVVFSDAEWADYLFYRNNLMGPHRERWLHSFGCRQWFIAERYTVTHEISGVFRMDEALTPAEGAETNE